MKSAPPSSQVSTALVEVYRNAYVTVLMDPRVPIVRLVRSDVPYPSIEALEMAIRELIGTLDRLGREGRCLLNDLRAASGRNDPAFEETMQRLRPQLYRGFSRIGLLVRSSAGALQLKRMMREDGDVRMATTDEAALIDYLLGAPSSQQESSVRPLGGEPRRRR